MHDPQALYYTFSTIAQALAGALAVLVAFVLFKLSDLDRAVQLAQFELQGKYTDWMPFWKLLCEGGLKSFDKEAKPPEQSPRIRGAYQAGSNAWRLRPRILRVLSYALIGSVVDIAVCFTALPWTPSLAGSQWATLAVGGTVGLGVICLALYVWLIFMVVEPPTAQS